MPFYSLRTRLVLLVTVALLPVFGLVTYNSMQRQQESLQQARQDMVTTTRLAALSYERTARGAHQLLQAITSAPVIKRHDMAGCTAFMQDLRSKFPEYSNLGLADQDGRMICDSVNRTEVLSIADRPYFRQVMASRAFVISNYLIGRVSGNPALAFAIPNFDSNQQIRGIAFAAMDLKRLAMDNPIGTDQMARLVVTDRRGTVVASGDPTATTLGSDYAHSVALAAVVGSPTQTFDTLDANGFEVMQATVAIGDGTSAGLLVHGSLRKADITRGDQLRLTRSLVWLFFFTFIGALVANWLGVKTIVAPSVRLLRKVQALTGSSGTEPPTPVQPRRGADELAELSTAVDHLARTLSERGSARDAAEHRVAQRLRQHEGLTALALHIARATTLDDICQSACRQLAHTLGAELTAVMQVLPGGQQLRLEAGTGWGPGVVGTAVFSTAPGTLTGWTLSTHAPVQLADALDADGQPRFVLPDLLRHPPVSHGLQVRLQVAGKPWGVLGVYTRQPGPDFVDEVHVIESVSYLLSVAMDRLAAQRAAANNLQRMNDAQRIAQLGAWRMALPTREVVISGEAQLILGVHPDEPLRANDGYQVYAPEYVETMRERVTACANEGITFDVEAEIIRHGGERAWVRVIGEPDRDADGLIVAVQGAIQDISVRKDTERQLGRLSARLSNTLENITDAFFLLNAQWQFLFVNEHAARLLHSSRESLMSGTLWDAFPDTVGSILDQKYNQVLLDRQPQRFEY